MKDRIRLFLKDQNKTSSQFANEIGVQPSAVSHVLSGRNKPSLDFVIKMLETFSDLNSDWLLFGKGDMYIGDVNQSLFDAEIPINELNNDSSQGPDESKTESGPEIIDSIRSNGMTEKGFTNVNKPFSEKIIVFYPDGTFEEYNRRNMP